MRSLIFKIYFQNILQGFKPDILTQKLGKQEADSNLKCTLEVAYTQTHYVTAVFQSIYMFRAIILHTVYVWMACLRIIMFQGYASHIIEEGFPLFRVKMNAKNWKQRKQGVFLPRAQGQSSVMTSGRSAQGLGSSEFNVFCDSRRSLAKRRKQPGIVVVFTRTWLVVHALLWQQAYATFSQMMQLTTNKL